MHGCWRLRADCQLELVSPNPTGRTIAIGVRKVELVQGYLISLLSSRRTSNATHIAPANAKHAEKRLTIRGGRVPHEHEKIFDLCNVWL